jgi:hypothetical protein
MTAAGRPPVLSRVPWLAVAVFMRRLLVGVVFGYVLGSLLLGGTALARPVFHALTAAWAALLGLHAWRQWRLPVVLRRVELVATNIALTLLLAELALRAGGLAVGKSLLVNATLDAHRLVPGHDYGHGLRGNSLGYPGPEFRRERRPGIRRIAALGDSFAVGPAVPFADNYLTVLEKGLPATEVYNFGVSAAGPREYLQILRGDVWAFQPDLVLVSVFVGNDITEELATPRHLDPRQHALFRLGTRSLALAREWWRQGHAPGSADGDRLAHPPLSPETFREVEARRLAVCVHPVSEAMEKKWRRALGWLDRIVAECHTRGAPVAFVLIPDELQVNPRVLAEAVKAAGVDSAAVDVHLPQRRLQAFCAERRVACLDLRPALAEVPDAYAPFDTHWGMRGNHAAADCIRQWLWPQLAAPGVVATRPSGRERTAEGHK